MPVVRETRCCRGREGGSPRISDVKGRAWGGCPWCHPSHLSPGPGAALPVVRGHAEPERGQIKRGQAKATLLLSEHIRLGFSAFAGRDSHL